MYFRQPVSETTDATNYAFVKTRANKMNQLRQIPEGHRILETN